GVGRHAAGDMLEPAADRVEALDHAIEALQRGGLLRHARQRTLAAPRIEVALEYVAQLAAPGRRERRRDALGPDLVGAARGRCAQRLAIFSPQRDKRDRARDDERARAAEHEARPPLCA